ncbi:hypothetical protein DERF_014892 [Dermatophagoides farinae]|uniref:Uncharacterized protein n=1 Tax=Dermatophagoides farinae TaxID=6954 RepID=A0A922HN78_DERFA|nr:hypothetical protein DERF_014892 [Dermatophagoides farinae]
MPLTEWLTAHALHGRIFFLWRNNTVADSGRPDFDPLLRKNELRKNYAHNFFQLPGHVEFSLSGQMTISSFVGVTTGKKQNA